MRIVVTILVLALSLPAIAQQQMSSDHASSSSFQQAGIAYLKQGRAEEALLSFRAAVAADPKDAVSHDYIGVILGETGKLNDAIGEFEQASNLDPTLPDPHFHLGVAYQQIGRPSDAIFQYQEALRLNPALIEARYGLSAICAKIGDLDGAIYQLRELFKLAPDFGEAHYNLGLNLWNRYKNSAGVRQKKDLDEGLEELLRANELEPQQARIQFALGQISADRGDLAAAVEYFHKVVALDPSNPEYHYKLGLAL